MKNIFVIFLLAIVTNASAQFVNIPDSNFRKYLITHYPSAMIGNNMDTNNTFIISANNMNLDSMGIKDLEGIQYFDALTYLICTRNEIKKINALPPALENLYCTSNQLDSLPTLPSSLLQLHCRHNNLIRLPLLPNSIDYVDCSFNAIDSLDNYPVSLQTLICTNNALTALPTFTNTIKNFNCSNNQIQLLPPLGTALNDLDVSGNDIALLPTLPNSLISLNCSQNNLNQLPALPNNLQKLNCSKNNLNQLPSLNANLKYLYCAVNQINALPTLTANLLDIDCSFNNLSVMPTLPGLLQNLICANNSISTLPTLPSSLRMLNCASNTIPSLPALPASLEVLNYSQNPISALPVLPASLLKLFWNYNNTTPQLPTLPSGLLELYVSFTKLDSLPTLPSSLLKLSCNNDSLLFLPSSLPPGLRSLICDANDISVLPTLSSVLDELSIASTLITNIPYLPPTILKLTCSSNSGLFCLPKLPKNMQFIQMNNTGISCLPNFVIVKDTFYTSSNFFTMPLCMPSSGCPLAWNIAGNLHLDTSINCTTDALFPGPRASNLKVNLLQSGNIIESTELTALGEYSFDINVWGNYQVNVDTTNLPFNISCPSTSVHSLSITALDSLKPNTNFGLKCDSVDAGVKNLYGRFRVGQVAHVQIRAGDLAQAYNVVCPSFIPATVTTVITGPVTYLQPSANALSPVSAVGNVLQYNVPNIAAIDFNTAFNIDVLTDSTANFNQIVCVETSVNNGTNDMDLSNNSMKLCFNVVNSFDPNHKSVYPTSLSKGGDTLTYTIQFQNTGNDTAFNVVIKDTLSENLDWSTFHVIGSSHAVKPVLIDNAVSFIFNGINLLDSVHNEPLSHGFVQYKIRLKSPLEQGTRTDNVAHIYFDLNPAIVTDTAINFIGIDPRLAFKVNPFIFPNAFTPDNDGLNDSWKIINKSYIEQKRINIESIVIKNRYGRVVYASAGNNFEWKPGFDLPMDTYVYFINYKSGLGDQMYAQHGFVILIR